MDRKNSLIPVYFTKTDRIATRKLIGILPETPNINVFKLKESYYSTKNAIVICNSYAKQIDAVLRPDETCNCIILSHILNFILIVST